MNINKISQTNFKGYENIISHTIKNKYDDSFAFMTMKLNNIGKNDLDIWNNLQKDLLHIEKPSEYITIQALNKSYNTYFGINNNDIDPYKAKSTEEEKFILRGLDLIASLTRRIINTEHQPEDGQIYLSLVEAIKFLRKIAGDERTANEVAMIASMKKIPHHETAKLINNQISQKMMRYFR